VRGLYSVEDIKQDILKKDIDYIYNEYLLGSYVWYFDEKFSSECYQKYDRFKRYVSKKLEVHFNDVAIIGSEKIGFSLNPSKNFKLFHSKSDIDIIVVSQSLYYAFWNEYLKEHNSITGIKNGKYSYVCKCVFKKFITLDGFDTSNDFYLSWEIKTKGFEKDLQLMFQIDNDIHYRIFESWDAVKLYYTKGILENKRKLEGEL